MSSSPSDSQLTGCPVQDFADDMVFTNPIGVKKGEHKYTIVGEAILGLPEHLRYSWQYILLLAVTESQLQKTNGGMIWTLCGRDSDNALVEIENVADDFRKLEQGHSISVTDDSTGTPTST